MPPNPSKNDIKKTFFVLATAFVTSDKYKTIFKILILLLKKAIYSFIPENSIIKPQTPITEVAADDADKTKLSAAFM